MHQRLVALGSRKPFVDGRRPSDFTGPPSPLLCQRAKNLRISAATQSLAKLSHVRVRSTAKSIDCVAALDERVSPRMQTPAVSMASACPWPLPSQHCRHGARFRCRQIADCAARSGPTRLWGSEPNVHYLFTVVTEQCSAQCSMARPENPGAMNYRARNAAATTPLVI